MDGLTVVLAVLAVVAGIALSTTVGAVILRAAVSLYNLMAGAQSAAAVPSPSFAKALEIVFLSMVTNAAVGTIVGLLAGVTGSAANLEPDDVIVIGGLLSLPAGFFVMATMISVSLPTTFGRSILVTLCQHLIVLVMVGLSVFAASAGAWVLG